MDLLDEWAHSQALVVEERPVIAVLLRYPASRQLQTRLAGIGGRYKDDTAALGDPIRNIELLQLGDRAATLFSRQPGVQDRIGRIRGPQDDHEEGRGCQGGTGYERSSPGAVQDRPDPVQNTPSQSSC